QTNNQENNKNTTQEYITPLPPTGESPDGDHTVLQNDDEVKSKKRKPAKPKNNIDYQAILDFYNEQNELHGKRLPNAIDLNDKRKRGIVKILNLLNPSTLDGFKNYIEAFFERATEFYFGGNNRNWRASFDYLLREDTLTKVREEAL
ncbi:replication protein, partial [Gallibacterium anatis]